MTSAVADSRSLATKYRPNLFSEVIGQEGPVTYLRNLVRLGKRTRHILFYGSIGSGKTSLARIYAKALQCETLAADWSPCLNCDGCRSVDIDPERFVEIDAPGFDNEEVFRAKIKALTTSQPLAGSRRVIFIDEAHSLRRFPDSFDVLLKLLESSPPEIAYIFATTEPDRISGALKSRMTELKVRPLSIEQGKELLRGILERQGVPAAEEEALNLIWGLGDGQPRNMLQALDQVLAGGVVTRDRVRDVFDVKDTDAVLNYFIALGEGDVRAQSRHFVNWASSAQMKVARIQGLLVSIYYNDLIGQSLIVEPVISSINAGERKPIVEAFQRRFPDRLRLMCAWQEMLGLLPVNPNELSSEALLAKIILFQERVCSHDLGAAIIATDERPLEMRPAARSAAKAKVHSRDRDPAFLSLDQVRKIYNSASAFTQAFGRQFNVKIEVHHAAFGCGDQKAAGKNAGEFCSALSQRLKAWFGNGDRMLIQEVDTQDGFCARVIASLPNSDERTVADLHRWIRQWRLRDRSESMKAQAVLFEVLGESERMGAQWECVRWLCAGLDPKESTREQLRLGRRVAGDIGTGNRFASSDSCGENLKRLAADVHGLPFLSAFNSQAWTHIYSGWELQAHELRKRLAGQSENDLEAGTTEARIHLDGLRSALGLGLLDPHADF